MRQSKEEIIAAGHYCNKEHKDRDLPSKDDHIENDYVYCDWCPYYSGCTDSPCPENLRDPEQ